MLLESKTKKKKMILTPSDYEDLFNGCMLKTGHDQEFNNAFNVIIAHFSDYSLVEHHAGIPAILIACLHFRESGLNFNRHLHNGDPLTARTVHVPSGRPIAGNPPFSWTDSAVDALSAVWKPQSWSLGAALEFCERYNGLGYQKLPVPIYSPYVWSYTNVYDSGLFVADGTFDQTKISQQAGCAALFKALNARGLALDFTV